MFTKYKNKMAKGTMKNQWMRIVKYNLKTNIFHHKNKNELPNSPKIHKEPPRKSSTNSNGCWGCLGGAVLGKIERMKKVNKFLEF